VVPDTQQPLKTIEFDKFAFVAKPGAALTRHSRVPSAAVVTLSSGDDRDDIVSEIPARSITVKRGGKPPAPPESGLSRSSSSSSFSSLPPSASARPARKKTSPTVIISDDDDDDKEDWKTSEEALRKDPVPLVPLDSPSSPLSPLPSDVEPQEQSPVFPARRKPSNGENGGEKARGGPSTLAAKASTSTSNIGLESRGTTSGSQSSSRHSSRSIESSDSNEEEPDFPNLKRLSEKVASLKQIFPAISAQDIRGMLISVDLDTEQAADLLAAGKTAKSVPSVKNKGPGFRAVISSDVIVPFAAMNPKLREGPGAAKVVRKRKFIKDDDEDDENNDNTTAPARVLPETWISVRKDRAASEVHHPPHKPPRPASRNDELVVFLSDDESDEPSRLSRLKRRRLRGNASSEDDERDSVSDRSRRVQQWQRLRKSSDSRGGSRNGSRSNSRSQSEAEAEDEDEDMDEDHHQLSAEDLPVLHQKALSFFEDAPGEDVIKMFGEDVAPRILRLRPFGTFAQVSVLLEETSGLNISHLDRCLEIMEKEMVVDSSIEFCERLSADLLSVLEGWSVGGATATSTAEQGGAISLTQASTARSAKYEQHIERQPRLVSNKLALKDYQLLGINWLNLLHQNKIGGILADEMGLGKTAQVICFLAHLLEKGNPGPHIVIVPASTVENWAREIERWCPSLELLTYYGSQKERLELRMNLEGDEDVANIILTTYTVATGQKEDRVFLKRFAFQYLILDEAHFVKNMDTQRYKHLMRFKTKYRLLLTGTPLQNNLGELMCLVNFVAPELFGDNSAMIQKLFAGAAGQARELLSVSKIAKARKIMAPFVLRRLKSQVLQQLPKKSNEVELVPMTPFQVEIYDLTFAKSKKEYKQDGKRLHNIFMQLRKMGNHPCLERFFYDDDKLRIMAKDICKEMEYMDSDPTLVLEDMQVMSDFELDTLCQRNKSIRPFCMPPDRVLASGKIQYLARALPEMKQRGDRVLIFSQFTMVMDILEVALKRLGHTYQRLDGTTPVPVRQKLIDEFNENEEIFVFLLSTKAGGFGINLTGANVVIIHDIDCNPQNDRQAEDRSHRVGQTRDVRVVKLISQNSIEETILQQADRKIELDKTLSGSGDLDKKYEAGILDELRLKLFGATTKKK